ncbi:MAG TPA: hypothetical protein VFB00_11340, partial [Terriglobales bacterium]|nr:hypothetical protein [Terriglobales bacterium]
MECAHMTGRGVFGCLVLVLMLGSCALAQVPVAKAAGTVKSVSGNSLVLITDNGNEVSVTLADTARILRAAPGQTDLKAASPIRASDIQAGDRILVRGQAGDGGAVLASVAVVMKQTDLAERQQRELEEWRRGVGGIVKEVDAKAGAITIANAMLASGKPITIHVSKDTELRRYASDSVKFADARPGTLEQIRPGDQVRARGSRSAEGTEFNAQALVSGTFRDIAGTIVSADAADGSLTIMDLASKKPVRVKTTPDSQLHKLPDFVAMRIATRLRGGPEAANASGSPGQAPPAAAASGGNWRGASNPSGQPGVPGMPGGGNWQRPNGGPPDFQQMLSHMPPVSISDLKKGDAVIL